MTSDQITSARPPPTRHIVLLGAALALPAIPNVVYLCSVKPAAFWLGQTVTALLLLATPLLLGVRPRFALWLVAPFALISPVLGAYAFVTGYAPSLFALQVLREATREELANFIPAAAFCAAAAGAIGFAYWRIGRLWRRHDPRRLPRWLRLGGLAVLALVLSKDILVQGLQAGAPILLSRLEKLAPFSPAVLLVHLEAAGPVIPDRAAVLAQTSVRLSPAAPEREVCVLVIGESARKRAYGLYDAAVPTTPRLAARPLVVFTDATACGTATIQAVPILMTGRFPGPNEILPFHEPGLVEVFRAAGYDTHWFSTQEADGEISSFITAFSVNAGEKVFVNGRLERSARRDPELHDDGALLPLLAQAVARPGRQFVVLHLLGSHLPYVRRYPAGFGRWPVDPAAQAAMWRWVPPFDAEQRTQLDHAYLNTVLYTDTILDRVIETLEATGASCSMFYLSDHGENDSAAPLMPASHGVLTDDVVDIPFFCWFSDAFRATHAAQLAVLAAHRDRPVSAQDLFSTVCALHGLETSAADPERNLASSDYREHPRYVFSLDGHTIPLGR